MARAFGALAQHRCLHLSLTEAGLQQRTTHLVKGPSVLPATAAEVGAVQPLLDAFFS